MCLKFLLQGLNKYRILQQRHLSSHKWGLSACSSYINWTHSVINYLFPSYTFFS